MGNESSSQSKYPYKNIINTNNPSLQVSPLKRILSSNIKPHYHQQNHHASQNLKTPSKQSKNLVLNGLDVWGNDDEDDYSSDVQNIGDTVHSRLINRKLPIRGVSTKWFLEFVRNDNAVNEPLMNANYNNYKVKDLVNSMIKSMKCDDLSIIDKIDSDENARIRDIADVVIISSPNQPACDLIMCLDDMLSKYSRNNQDVFFWFLPFVLVKRRIDSKLMAMYVNEVIETIKNTLIVYPSRNCLCFDESSIEYQSVMHSASIKGVRLKLFFPQSQYQLFCECIYEDPKAAMSLFKCDDVLPHLRSKKSHSIAVSPIFSDESTVDIETARNKVEMLINDWKITRTLDFISCIEDAANSNRNHLLEMSSLYENAATILSIAKEHSLQAIYMQKSLDIKMNYFGEVHSEVAKCLNTIGISYFNQGLYDEAQIKFEKAVSTWISTLGPKNSCVAVGVHNLAYVFYMKKEDEKANLLIAECKAIKPIKNKSSIMSILADISHDIHMKDQLNSIIQCDKIVSS